MLHHLSFSVSDINRSVKFYDAVLGALGYIRVWTYPNAVGYGFRSNEDKFAIKFQKHVIPPSQGFHVAFAARSRGAVDNFYVAAIANGAKPGHDGIGSGIPKLRTKFGPNYYATFVTDLDGYQIEAVINKPDRPPSKRSLKKTPKKP